MIEYGLFCVFGCANALTLITHITNHNRLPAISSQWWVGGLYFRQIFVYTNFISSECKCCLHLLVYFFNF